MKKVKHLITLMGFVISLLGCAEANTHPVIPPPKAPEEPADCGCSFTFPEPVMLTPLAGTQWELVGSIEVETGKLTVYQHAEECTDCYSLDFDTDSTATFHNIKNQRIDLFHLDTCMTFAIEDIDMNESQSAFDARCLMTIMRTVGSYSASENVLKLYYYGGKLCYLLFNRKEQ